MEKTEKWSKNKNQTTSTCTKLVYIIFQIKNYIYNLYDKSKMYTYKFSYTKIIYIYIILQSTEAKLVRNKMEESVWASQGARKWKPVKWTIMIVVGPYVLGGMRFLGVLDGRKRTRWLTSKKRTKGLWGPHL
jgi:hypothetical protein